MSDLNDKIKDIFPDESVYKSSGKYNIFSGHTLPSFVKDWLIKKFTDEDEDLDEQGLRIFLNQHIAHKESKIKGSLLNDYAETVMLARIIIEPDIKFGILRFSIPDVEIKMNEGQIPKHIAQKYPKLKGGEVWGIVKLAYIPPDGKYKGSIEIVDFKSFQPYEVNLEYFKDKRRNFSVEEWIDVIIRSMEYNPSGFQSISQKLLFISRLLVFLEPNLNMIELAPKGTGKSYVFNNLSKYGWVVSGGVVSRAKLLYDVAKETKGIITMYDFVALDEIETIKFTDESELQGALKNYLESGNFSVAKFRGTSDASFMILGNIPLSRDPITNENKPIQKKYFENLHRFLKDSALLDRFHGFIEGWKLPRMQENLILRGYALNVEYFSEILHEMRTQSEFANIVNNLVEVPKNADTRDTKAILKISSGYLKLLFPHVKHPDEIDKEDFKIYCLDPARNMRKIIKKQISLIDPEFNENVPQIKLK